MIHTHTPEQTSIIAAARDTTSNLMLNALAGTGKTTTLELLETAAGAEPCLYLAFNKANAKDAEKRMRTTTQTRTFNSLGHRVWASTTRRKLALDGRKTWDIVRELIKARPRWEQTDLWTQYSMIVDAVGKAKTFGYIPDTHEYTERATCTQAGLMRLVDEELSHEAWELVDDAILRSIAASYAGTIDYADQIYMPTLFSGVFPTFPLTMVDEYQDLNPLNHVMIRKLTRAGRLIGVGDPNQNIYQFRGALPAGMGDAIAAHAMTELPLSVSFRCPEAIVRSVHWHVPDFKWCKPGGRCIQAASLRLVDFVDGAAIICRNNAPLFALAMRLLYAGRSISLAGSDIGPKMLTQMRKLGDDDTPKSRIMAAIDTWEAEKVSRGSSAATDTAACMRIFAGYGDNLAQAIAYAEHLFVQKGSLALLTGHKSKGLQWPTVYHLDSFLCRDGDENLRYVISTRSEGTYIEITSERIEG